MLFISLANLPAEECIEIAKREKYVELRFDLLDFKDEHFAALKTLEDVEIIATCRPKKAWEDKQKDILRKAMENGATYVDIEYEAPIEYREELIKIARQNKVQVIISYHNYHDTPAVEYLENVIDMSFDMGADVVKLACMAWRSTDNAAILGLYHRRRKLIAFNMGEAGRMTRITSLLLGARLSYAALSGTSGTAPGQMTKTEMEQALKIFNITKESMSLNPV